jgi:hypothetical protein
MDLDKYISIANRLLSIGVVALLSLAILEGLAQAFGYTIVSGNYAPGRLLELAGILGIFVIALLLRQVRETLKNGARQ